MPTVPTITTQPNQPRAASVTRGGSGIGEAVCRKFGEDSFRVIVGDLDMAAVENWLQNSRMVLPYKLTSVLTRRSQTHSPQRPK